VARSITKRKNCSDRGGRKKNVLSKSLKEKSLGEEGDNPQGNIWKGKSI